MKINRNGFTMIELVFVIVVLGILASVAIPRLTATRDDAELSKARSTIAAVRSGIVNERQARLFRGEIAFINRLDAGVSTGSAGVTIFDNNGFAESEILVYGVTTKVGDGGWLKTGNNEYTITLEGTAIAFDYTQATGRFDCNRNAGGKAGTLCRNLTD